MLKQGNKSTMSVMPHIDHRVYYHYFQSGYDSYLKYFVHVRVAMFVQIFHKPWNNISNCVVTITQHDQGAFILKKK